MWKLINALGKPSLGAPVHVTKILHAENGQKLDELNGYISVTTDIDENMVSDF